VFSESNLLLISSSTPLAPRYMTLKNQYRHTCCNMTTDHLNFKIHQEEEKKLSVCREVIDTSNSRGTNQTGTSLCTKH
jgi:hypothetical protein